MHYTIVILLIGFAVLIHELGHLCAALLCGVPVRVFSIGFGPTLLSREIKGISFRLSLVPVGGYVMADIDSLEEFTLIPVWKRMVFTLAGPAASILLSFFCFAMLFGSTGGFSAETLCIKPLSFILIVSRDMISGLPSLFTRHNEVSGIIGIVAQSREFTTSILSLVNFTALMSLNFGILNLLPIPALDGGKIFLLFLEKVHSRLTVLYYPLTLAGWVLIMGAMVYFSIQDVGKLVFHV